MAEIRIADIRRMKEVGKKVVLMTAYYYEMARAIDRAEPDAILVGDSGGRFLLGHLDNNDVTLDEMILMTRSVCWGTHAVVIGDLPFMSYQVGVEDAIRSAGRLVKETRCDAVKLEGGAEFASVVEGLVRVGIPVLGHMGLTPMTASEVGGYAGGATLPDERVLNDARALEEAGAFAIILTGITPEQGKLVTQNVGVPTISGFGAGDDCDGFIGVSPGTLGWTADHIDNPRSRYPSISKAIYEESLAYIADARAGRKPTARPTSVS